MKTIVVSGARSDVGKTTLARRLLEILPGAVYVKIGHGMRKKGMDNIFYPGGTPYGKIKKENGEASFLIIESNSVLKEMTPGCAIYLPGDNPKESAAVAADKADITRGGVVSRKEALRLAERLEVSRRTMEEIIRAAGARPSYQLEGE